MTVSPDQSSHNGLISAESITAEPITWLWPGYLPAGMITILDGDPGASKSTLALDLAARLSAGQAWPAGAGRSEPAAVLILNGEDSLSVTVKPRLAAAGANLGLITFWDFAPDQDEHGQPAGTRPVTFPVDLHRLEEHVTTTTARLVIVDVLMAYLAGSVDSHKDQDVRRILRELGAIAGRTGAAIVMLRHLNKNTSGPAIYRGGGSIGIIGAARVGYAVIRDANDPDTRLLTCIKCNIAPEPATLAYRLRPAGEVATIEWIDGTDARTADDLLTDQIGAPARRRDAETWLLKYGANNVGTQAAADVTTAAAKDGISRTTLQRAKDRLGIVATKPGESWQWTWPELANP